MGRARELRFAFTVDDFDAAVRLFRDVLGLETLMDLEEQGGRGVILQVPSATLELFDIRHTDVVDEIEVGRLLGERVRIAVRVGDLEDAARAVAVVGRRSAGRAGPDALGRPEPALPDGERDATDAFQLRAGLIAARRGSGQVSGLSCLFPGSGSVWVELALAPSPGRLPWSDA